MKAATATMRVSFHNVLFLTDFSEPSEAAVPFLTAVARAYGSRTFVLNVLLPDPLLYSTPTAINLVEEAQRDTANAAMQQVAAQLSGLPYEMHIEWRPDVWPIAEQAIKSNGIDLVVVGTHGRTGTEKLLLGSVAEEIFRRSPVPVLTVGPAVSKGMHGGRRFHCVLFATDFSARSLGALPYALSLAQENQARLILLHVLQHNGLNAPTLSQTAIAAAFSKLKDLIPEGTDNWCRPETLVESGEPAARILEIGKKHGADLIVLGVRNSAEHLGSAIHLGRATAHRVVVDAPCPVHGARVIRFSDQHGPECEGVHMRKGHKIRCYDYVNRPYEPVRDALKQNALNVFQSATKAAASHVQSIAAELHVDVGSLGVKSDVRISVSKVLEETDAVSAPTTRLLLEWQAVTMPRLFPLMNGELAVYPLTPIETQLDFSGIYKPPFGVLGKTANAIIGHRVAEASIHHFVSDVAAYLRQTLV